MHAFLADIGIALIVASLLGFLAHRSGQPIIVSYLIAGIIIGPEIGPQLVRDPANIELISEIGLILLLFVIGLEISPQSIFRSGKLILTAGLGQFVLSLAAGLFVFSWATGLAWSHPTVLYLGVFGSLGSTAIVVKMLYDKYELDSIHGKVSVGILIFQDIWAIVILALQPTLQSPGILPVLQSLLYAVLLTVVAFLLSKYALRWIFARLESSPELVVSAAIAWCIALCGLAALLNLSVEMGALIAGISISSFPYSLHVTNKVLPLRDVFLTLFFVSLGMKIPMPELSLLLWLGLLVGFLLISRPLIIYPLVRLGGGSDRTAFLSSVNLLQFSEFSLVIGAMGLELGHIDRSLFSALLYGLVLTSILSSYGIKYSHWVYRFWQRLLPAAVSSPVPPGADVSGSQSESETRPGEERTIFILGYHRGAQSMVANLLQHRPEVLERITVVDFNAEVLQQLQHTPVKGVFGDLSDRSTLEHVGMQKARVILITIPDLLLKGTSNRHLVQLCRAMAPSAAILATADDKGRAQKLREAGADGIVMPDHYIGEMLSRTLLRLQSKQEILDNMED